MPPRPKPKSITYELAVAEITETFDPLPMTPRPVSTREWVMESNAAEILGVTKKALERRRSRGTGPTSHTQAGYVAYYLEDLDAWVTSKPKAYLPPSER
tara:strand:+ start:13799 stop:14095 length:297 start_codon:yes stop_codon:yes gene_type:complete